VVNVSNQFLLIIYVKLPYVNVFTGNKNYVMNIYNSYGSTASDDGKKSTWRVKEMNGRQGRPIKNEVLACRYI